MTPQVVTIRGRKYFSTHKTAERLGISDRTVLRWIAWIEKGCCPDVLEALRWIRNPVNGFNYCSASSVVKVKKAIVAGQRICPNNCMGPAIRRTRR